VRYALDDPVFAELLDLISMLEGVGGVEKLLDVVPVDRVLFGSHLPLFVLESAVFKMRES